MPENTTMSLASLVLLGGGASEEADAGDEADGDDCLGDGDARQLPGRRADSARCFSFPYEAFLNDVGRGEDPSSDTGEGVNGVRGVAVLGAAAALSDEGAAGALVHTRKLRSEGHRRGERSENNDGSNDGGVSVALRALGRTPANHDPRRESPASRGPDECRRRKIWDDFRSKKLEARAGRGLEGSLMG
jgi:hypothetical protein